MNKVNIGKLEYFFESSSYRNVDDEKFFDRFFNKDNTVLKNGLCKCLKTLSTKLNIFLWDLKFEIFRPHKNSHYCIYILISSSYFEDDSDYERGVFVNEKSKTLDFTRFDIINIDIFEKLFINFINDNSVFFVIPKKYYKEAGENKSCYSVFNKEHDNFQSKIDYLDNLFGHAIINDMYDFHTYILGDKFYIAARVLEPLIEIWFEPKKMLRDLFFKKEFNSKISNEELNMIFESDDIEEIVQNIRLLLY